MFDFQVADNAALVSTIVPEMKNRTRAWLG